jgi:hypothetical protein
MGGPDHPPFASWVEAGGVVSAREEREGEEMGEGRRREKGIQVSRWPAQERNCGIWEPPCE